MDTDAVIIGTTFKEETVRLARKLEEREISYLFVDSTVENTSPLAYFTSDHYVCGYLIARLITSITAKACRIGMMQAVRIGDESANTSILRKMGFSDYFRERNLTNEIVRIPFTAMEPDKYDQQLDHYFQGSYDFGGVVVLNSRGGILADYFYRKSIRDVRLICVDLTRPNVQGLRKRCHRFPDRPGARATGLPCHEDPVGISHLPRSRESAELCQPGYPHQRHHRLLQPV